MRTSSGCRGSTCVEIAIMLGVIGALVIFVTAAGLRRFELTYASSHGGAMCQ